MPTPTLSPESPAEFPLEIPRDLLWLTPRYEFVRELGRGMAVVYLARERDTGADEAGREVAVKVVAPPHAADRETMERFAREARTATALNHPNIVRTLAIETSGDAVAIVTEYISGQTLRAMLQARGALPFSRAAGILRDVAAALAHAHAARIVHRDVKPENIFIETGTGRALLGDFGIARSIDADALLTHDGASLGTPAYMAPEQVDGFAVDERTDVYALGLLGWEMLTGRRPWQGETLYALLQKQKTEALPDLARLRPDVPLFLHRAIEGALAKNPAARWRDADEMLEQLSPAPERLPELSGAETRAATDVPPEVITGRTVQFQSGDLEALRPSDYPDAPSTVLPGDYMRDRAAITQLPAPRRRGRRWVAALAAAAALAGAAVAATHHSGPPSSGDPQLDSLLARATPPATRSARGGPAVDSATPSTAAGTAPTRPTTTSTPGQHDTTRPDSARRDALHRDSAAGTVVAAPDSLTLTGAPPAAPPTVAPPSNTAGARAPAAHLTARDACRSPANTDQRRCLMSLIYRSDILLQRNYDALIGALRRRSGGATEPPAVRALRAEQRAWVDARDRECAREVPLARAAHWGVARAPCFSGFSSRRAALLAARLRGKASMAQ